jgi:7-carboxy-7-deazaguanine synthase
VHDQGFQVAIETNGTINAPPGIDWICVSPKHGAPFIQRGGNELKLVIPQTPVEPLMSMLKEYEQLPFDHFLLQPLDGPDLKANSELAIRICQSRPMWRLSTQTHKILGIR